MELFVNETGVTDDVITCDKTEYSSHTITEVVDGKTGMGESWLQYPGLESNEHNKIDKG